MDDAVNEFINEARQYCRLIEQDPSGLSSWTFAQQCLHSLLRLYLRGLALPDVMCSDKDTADRLGYEDWKVIRSKVGERLARDMYWEVFEPLEKEMPTAVAGSISDDLADIWLDVQVGLHSFDAGTPASQAAAVWHWRFSLESHWARHVAGAVSALTALCFGEHQDETRPMKFA